MFFYIGTIFRDPDRQRWINIEVEGPFPWTNFLHVWSLILFLDVGNIPEESRSIWFSISKGSPPLPPTPPPPPTPSLYYRSGP